MKNKLLKIWFWLTGQKKILVANYQLTESGKYKQKWIFEDEYDDYRREQSNEYKSDLERRKTREIEFVWSLVGNIVDKHTHGEEKVTRIGAKQFSPGTKVYCFPPKWGDGYERIYVIGRPRRTTRFIKVIIKSSLVTNWRLQKVYSPHIKREMLMNNGWDDSDDSKARAETLLNSLLQND